MIQEFSYICSAKKNVTANISLLTFLPTTAGVLSHISGQYTEIQLPDGNFLPLSIANAPRADGTLEFHIRHQSDLPATQILLAQLTQYSQVLLRGPKGNSTLLRAKPDNHCVFLAGGTGFAPMKALLETALVTKPNIPLTLYWGIRRPEDAYDQATLLQWVQDFPHFRFEMVLSEPEHYPTWEGATGLVHEYCAAQQGDFAQTCVFASGPYEMVKAGYNLFTEQCLESTQFISDMH